MEGFHKRYIATDKVLKWWVEMVRQLDIEHIAPQHGAMLMEREHVERFIDWIEGLSCGVELFREVYRLPA
jgi:flavorubredoxin